MKDLIVTVADSYQEKVLEALLPRVPKVCSTNAFSFDIIQNPEHDPGSYHNSQELLRTCIKDYRFALVVLDFEGTGVEDYKTRQEIQNDISQLLDKNGWLGRNAAIVIAPELENWIWTDNVHVHDAIGWEKKESLYEWAMNNGFLRANQQKPSRPKETLEMALRISGTPKSAAIYRKIAANVSWRGCKDQAFKELIAVLVGWFGLYVTK